MPSFSAEKDHWPNSGAAGLEFRSGSPLSAAIGRPASTSTSSHQAPSSSFSLHYHHNRNSKLCSPNLLPPKASLVGFHRQQPHCPPARPCLCAAARCPSDALLLKRSIPGSVPSAALLFCPSPPLAAQSFSSPGSYGVCQVSQTSATPPLLQCGIELPLVSSATPSTRSW